MIQSKCDLYFYLFADRYMRYGEKNNNLLTRIFAKDYISDFLISMRWVAYYNNCVGKCRYLSLFYLFHKYRFSKLGVKLGFSIGYNSLGYGAVLPHYGTIVVNSKAQIGNYCVLHTCTCIAGEGRVGDGLYLSTGSIIVSPNLGDYVTVGANSLVHHPAGFSNVLMGGSPAIILKDNYCKWYDRDGWTNKIKYIESSKIHYYPK